MIKIKNKGNSDMAFALKNKVILKVNSEITVSKEDYAEILKIYGSFFKDRIISDKNKIGCFEVLDIEAKSNKKPTKPSKDDIKTKKPSKEALEKDKENNNLSEDLEEEALEKDKKNNNLSEDLEEEALEKENNNA